MAESNKKVEDMNDCCTNKMKVMMNNATVTDVICRLNRRNCTNIAS